MPNSPPLPHFFSRDGDGFIASGLARSPWSANALAGGPVSSLLATIAEQAGLDPAMTVARFSVDILGVVPNQLLTSRVTCIRAGRQMQLHMVELIAGDRVAARAHLLRIRHAETPAIAPPCPYPHPDTLTEGKFLIGATMAGGIRCKPIRGGVREPGPGTVWLACDGEIVEGLTPSPFVKAALFADFGNGVGSATHAHEWSYANLDITLQFLRMPVGDWFLLDAQTHMAGTGFGTASNTFADVQGIYARGFQTVFVAPGVPRTETKS